MQTNYLNNIDIESKHRCYVCLQCNLRDSGNFNMFYAFNILETNPDIVPVHGDVVVSVGSVVLVPEPEDVEQLVDHNPLCDAAVLMEPYLQPPHAGPVRWISNSS